MRGTPDLPLGSVLRHETSVETVTRCRARRGVGLRPALILAEPGPSFQGKTITFTSAVRRAVATTSMPASWRGISASTSRATRPSSSPTCPPRTGSRVPIFSSIRRPGTAPPRALLPYNHLYQVQGIEGIEYDAARFGWLGSIAPSNEVMYVWHTIPVYSIEDLKNRETILAPTSCRNLRASLNCRRRRALQARQGLSRHQRRESRDGARRGRSGVEFAAALAGLAGGLAQE